MPEVTISKSLEVPTLCDSRSVEAYSPRDFALIEDQTLLMIRVCETMVARPTLLAVHLSLLSR